MKLFPDEDERFVKARYDRFNTVWRHTEEKIDKIFNKEVEEICEKIRIFLQPNSDNTIPNFMPCCFVTFGVNVADRNPILEQLQSALSEESHHVVYLESDFCGSTQHALNSFLKRLTGSPDNEDLIAWYQHHGRQRKIILLLKDYESFPSDILEFLMDFTRYTQINFAKSSESTIFLSFRKFFDKSIWKERAIPFFFIFGNIVTKLNRLKFSRATASFLNISSVFCNPPISYLDQILDIIQIPPIVFERKTVKFLLFQLYESAVSFKQIFKMILLEYFRDQAFSFLSTSFKDDEMLHMLRSFPPYIHYLFRIPSIREEYNKQQDDQEKEKSFISKNIINWVSRIEHSQLTFFWAFKEYAEHLEENPISLLDQILKGQYHKAKVEVAFQTDKGTRRAFDLVKKLLQILPSQNFKNHPCPDIHAYLDELYKQHNNNANKDQWRTTSGVELVVKPLNANSKNRFQVKGGNGVSKETVWIREVTNAVHNCFITLFQPKNPASELFLAQSQDLKTNFDPCLPKVLLTQMTFPERFFPKSEDTKHLLQSENWHQLLNLIETSPSTFLPEELFQSYCSLPFWKKSGRKQKRLLSVQFNQALQYFQLLGFVFPSKSRKSALSRIYWEDGSL